MVNDCSSGNTVRRNDDGLQGQCPAPCERNNGRGCCAGRSTSGSSGPDEARQHR